VDAYQKVDFAKYEHRLPDVRTQEHPMARISVYVPDEMKSEMDKIGDGVNWSNAAQTAFEIEISRHKWLEEPSMSSVIDRLKASKIEFRRDEETKGAKHGRDWATNRASYAQLRQVAELNLDLYTDDFWLVFDRQIGTDGTRPEDSFWFEPGENWIPSDEYVTAFVEGAKEVWDEVAPKL
jgi:hypothetical protein